MRYFITFLLLFFATIAQEQEANNTRQDTIQIFEWLDEAIKLSSQQNYDASIALALKTLNIPHRRKVEAIHHIYLCYGWSGDWENALKYAQMSYEEAINTEPAFDPRVINNIVYDIAHVYDRLGEKDSAITYYTKSIELYKQWETIPNESIGLAHHNLSYHYKGYGYLEKALAHAKQAYHFLQKNSKEANEHIPALYTNMAQIYTALNAYDLAKDYYEKSINVGKQLELPNTTGYGNLAGLMADNGNFESAIYYSEKGIQELKDLSKQENIEILATLYNNIGRYQMDLDLYEESETALLKSIEINPNNIAAYLNLWTLYQKPYFGNYDEILEQIKTIGPLAAQTQGAAALPPIYMVRAKVMARKGQFDEAFTNFQYALNVAMGKDKNEPFDKNAFVGLDSIPNNDWMRKIFKGRAWIFKKQYEAMNKIDDLKMAFEHSLFTVELFEDYYLKMPFLQKTKTFETKEVYEEAIALGFELFEKTKDETYLERTFQLSEQFKGNEILSGLNEVNAKAELNLPKDILKKEQDIRAKLTYSKAEFYEAKKAKNTQKANRLEKKWTHWQQEYEALMQDLEKKYPNYFELKYQKAQVSISDVQQKVLASNQALIEYFVGNEHIYSWNIQKDKVSFYQNKAVKQLPSLIENLRNNITDYAFRAKNPQMAFKNYTANATQLFDILLKKVVADKNTKRLLIIPDEALNFLPFETLLTQKVDTNTINYKSLPFLMKEYSVAYAYASKLLLQKSKRKPQQYLAAFAPSYEQFAKKDTSNSTSLAILVRDGEAQLPGAQKEVKSITEAHNGQAFIGKTANEAIFKENASKYQILHLSMHALMDTEYPMRSHLVFEKDASQEDNLLQIGELYNMNIPADMVVLSACNSGVGKIRTGDGVQNLATAFNYAGAKSTVMSLWKVPDQSTAPVMIDFYDQLHPKKTKDEALRQAKINYLDNAVADELAHPLYWAGFIASGDMAAIQKNKSSWFWWLVAAGLIIAFLILLRKQSMS